MYTYIQQLNAVKKRVMWYPSLVDHLLKGAVFTLAVHYMTVAFLLVLVLKLVSS